MIRKLKSGEYRIYSRNKDAETGHRRGLDPAGKHGRDIQFFKRR